MNTPFSYVPSYKTYDPNKNFYNGANNYQGTSQQQSGVAPYEPINFGNTFVQPQAAQQPFTYGATNNSGMFSPMSEPSSGGSTPNIPNLPYGSIAAGIFQLPFAIKAYQDAKKAVLPQYQANPYLNKSMAEADAMRNQGFTRGEFASYNQQLGQDKQNTYNRAVQLSGGNMAQAISAILQGQNVGARNQIAIGDANLRRQNMQRADSQAAQQQEIANANTSLGIDQYNRKQQAAAALIQSTIGNLTNPMNYIGGIV